MLTNFLKTVGCETHEVKLKKKIIILADGSQRIVYDNEGHEDTHCRYCGECFDECGCDRTEHIYDEDRGCCINCLETFKPNGTGPSNNKFVHWFINIISWFNRWVSGISNKHDIGYFEGFLASRKKIEDDAMRDRTYKKIDKTWYLKPKSFWKKRADLNWVAVDKCGDSSFNWSGCVLPENVCKETVTNVKNSKQLD